MKEVKEVLVFLQGSYNDCFAVVVARIYELANSLENRNMKETLEYKILKYLSENSKNSFVSLDDFIEDKDILRLKLKTLIKDKLIDIKRIRTGEYSTRAEYMINSNGSIYLNTLENNRHKNINNNFKNSTIGQFNQDSEFFKSPNNIKTKDANRNNPVIKSRIRTILSNPWFIGISLALLAAIFNGKKFMSFINNIF